MSTKQQKASSRWERLIRQECAVLREEGLATVDKNWEAPTVPGTHIPREKSKPDFSGFLQSNGRHVVFEAKAIEEATRLDFDNVLEHQWEHLLEADDAGAVSFLYVLAGDGQRWLIPFANARKAAGSRSSIELQPGGELRQLGEWQRRGSAFVWHGENWFETLQRMGGLS